MNIHPNGEMKFPNLPKGKKAMIIAYSISKKTKQAKFAYAPVKLGNRQESLFNLKVNECV